MLASLDPLGQSPPHCQSLSAPPGGAAAYREYITRQTALRGPQTGSLRVSSSNLGRLRSHTGLQKLAAPLLKRPPGRPPEQPREWCHDLEYQAGSWPAPRRVVLVVQERPDDLLLHAFFLVTNLSKFDWPPEKVLALYRKRGSAEAHMGEVKSALDVHLSSTDRGASTVQGVMARNEVSLLLSLYAYQVLHGLRCLLERQTRQGWSLSRMREQVLKVAATLRLHARRITVHLGAAADKWWPTLLKGLPKLTALS